MVVFVIYCFVLPMWRIKIYIYPATKSLTENYYGYYYYLLITPKQLTCRHKNDKSSEHKNDNTKKTLSSRSSKCPPHRLLDKRY